MSDMFREWLRIAWSVRSTEATAVDAPQLPGVSVKGDTLTSPSASLIVTIRAITADRPTRNCTYYPLKELRGDGESTGYISFVRPYGVPVMLHHVTAPGLGATDIRSVLPVGRVIRSRLVRSGDEHYVELTARITDEWAIEAIRRGLLHTVSIGHIPEKVTCSICGAEMEEMDNQCSNGHRRGIPTLVRDDATGKQETRMCYAVMHGIRAVEVSFVNVPSDSRAMILDVKPDTVSGEAYTVSNIYREGGAALLTDREALENTVREEHGSTVAEAYAEEREQHRQESADAAVDTVARAGTVSEAEEEEQPADEPVQEDNTPVSAEELWFISEEELPEWAQEAKLTAAQRKRLPDSAFCGPNRSFPAHDRIHVLVGLRLLGRAKLSAAQKARVRACLIRKAARYGLPIARKGNDGESYALWVLHPAEVDSVRTLVLDTKEALEETAGIARELLSDDGWMEEIHSASVPGVVVLIPASVPTYEGIVRELMPVEEEEVQESGMTTEQTGAEHWRELAQNLFGLQEESVEQLLHRLFEQYQQTLCELEHYRSLVDEMEQEKRELLSELQRVKHESLVEEATRLAIAAGYPPARNRSYEQLREMFSARSDESLQTLIADLKESAIPVVPTDVQPPVPAPSAAGTVLPTGTEQSDVQSERTSSEEERVSESVDYISKIIDFLTSTRSRPEESEETEVFLIPSTSGGTKKS